MIAALLKGKAGLWKVPRTRAEDQGNTQHRMPFEHTNLSAVGLRVEISEMDVQIRNLPGNLQERLETQRKIYGRPSHVLHNEIQKHCFGHSDRYDLAYDYGREKKPIDWDKVFWGTCHS